MEIKDLFSSLLSSANEIIYFKDIQGRYIQVNTVWEKVTGIRHDQAVGKNDLELFDKDTAAGFIANDSTVRKTQSVIEAEELLKTDDDNKYYLSKKFPVIDSLGKIIATGGVSIDITGKKKLEHEIKIKEEQLSLITQVISEHKAKLKAITGLLPVCASCNSIRDTVGNWHKMDEYLHSHSTAQCSHTLCPKCANKLYPGIKIN